MDSSTQMPSAAGLQRERERLASTIRREKDVGVPRFDGHASVTDPVITPFVRALIAEGYRIKGALTQRVPPEACPECEGRYLLTFLKDEAEYRLCPHCRDLKDRTTT